MAGKTRNAWAWLPILLLSGTVAAQTVLMSDDVGVATTEGVFLVRANGPAIYLADSSVFGGPLSLPAIEWERGTDAFFVTTDARLFRVTVMSATAGGAVTVEITPSGGAVPIGTLRDLDADPGTGELWLLDMPQSRVLRLTPPFSLGMAASLDLPTPSNTRAIALDTRRYPLSLLLGRTFSIDRQDLDGNLNVEALFPRANGLDVDTQVLATGLFTRAQSDELGSILNPSAYNDINKFIRPGLPDLVPVLFSPQDVAWDGCRRRAYSLGQDGVSLLGFPGATGPNHILRFSLIPHASLPPRLITNPNGNSQIHGVDGDITLVHAHHSWTRPYGPTCTSPDGDSPRLETGPSYGYTPFVGNDIFRLQISDAPPGSPVWLFWNLAPADLSFQGCQLVVLPDAQQIPFLGVTAANGDLTVTVPIPNEPALLGIDVYAQAAILHPAPKWVLTQGLRLHLAAYDCSE